MKLPELIKVSKASITTKLFEIAPEKLASLSKEELDKVTPLLPTEEEKAFMEIYQSNAPQLVRLQRKMSVCLDVEVLELSDDKVSYEYGEKTFSIEEPKNAFRICSALEKSRLEAFSEMALQGCFFVGGTQVTNLKDTKEVATDEIMTALKVADKFFFQTFLGS